MFKDELNTAFGNIKPSPELLDRVSAMMNEEVSRKKPPLQLRAVKYAGIAAAVALAAGGTLLAVNSNNGIKTSGAGSPTTADNAAVQEIADFRAETTEATVSPESGAEANGGSYGEAETAIYDEAGYDADEEAEMFVAGAAPENEEAVAMDNSIDEAAADDYYVDGAAAGDARITPEAVIVEAPAPVTEEAPYAPDAIAVPEAVAEEAADVPDDASMEIFMVAPADYNNNTEDSKFYDNNSETIEESLDHDDAVADCLPAPEAPKEPAPVDAASADELPIEEPMAVEETAEDEAEVFIITVDDPTGVIVDIPKTAACGEIFEIKTGVVYDADVLIYADGEELERTHYDSDYWGFMFTMPDHDVVITVKFSSVKWG